MIPSSIKLTSWQRVIIALVLLYHLLPVAGGIAQETGTFEGTLMATGDRKSIDFFENRSVFTFSLEGHVNLKDAVGQTADFWAKWVGLWDTQTGGTARCVWKDGTGQKIFIVINGSQLEKGSVFTGEFVGGTGAFKGIQGNFSLCWTSLSLNTGDHVISGYTKNIKGSYTIP